jgi:release factor glutamine methyltransferase
MTVPTGPPQPAPAELVRRLRAAGCVFAEEEAALLRAARPDAEGLEQLVARRVAGEPLEHLLGWAEFAGLRVQVDPGVFVPRRRTELLVDRAVELVEAGSVVVDLCCGSGAVGMAVATAVPGVELHAADVDPAAVACARRNVGAVGGSVHEGDLYAAVPEVLRGRVDVLVVNAPYVPTEEIGTMPPEARLHEPRTALDGGGDGVELHRRVAAEAADWLSPGGRLIVETSRSQAPLTVAALRDGGLTATVVHDEERDGTAVVGASAPRSAGNSQA